MNDNVRDVREQIKDEIESSKYCDSWFVDEHLLIVEKLALQLCDLYPNANRDVVVLAVWFHDYSRVKGQYEKHDEHGARLAKEYLEKNGFDKQTVNAVSSACRTHRATNHIPESIDAKILATADAMSHFFGGFYLRLLHRWSDLDYQEARKKLLNKIERDYHDKMLLNEARQTIKPLYEAWHTIMSEVSIKTSIDLKVL